MEHYLLLIVGLLILALSEYFRFKMINIYIEETKLAPFGLLIPFTYLSFAREHKLSGRKLRLFKIYWILIVIALAFISISLILEILF